MRDEKRTIGGGVGTEGGRERGRAYLDSVSTAERQLLTISGAIRNESFLTSFCY